MVTKNQKFYYKGFGWNIEINKIGRAVLLCLFCCLSYVASKQFHSSPEVFVLGLCWICIASVFVIIKTDTLRCSKLFKLVIIIGYILRLGIAFWGTYGNGGVINFLNTGDQIGFLDIARQYYGGDFSTYYTCYPYILLWIFRIMGVNRMMPQLVNIMCWYFGILILNKMAGGLYGRSKCLLLIFYIFMPWPLLISTQLYREPIMSLFMMLVYYFLWKWMNTGRFTDIFYSAMLIIPLFLLHSGNIVMLPVIFFAYIQWDWKKRCWRKISKKWGIVLLGVFFIPVFFLIIMPRYSEYLPKEISLQSITSYPYIPGRTDYIPEGVDVKNWFQFGFWTIYRMFYFWFSPSPRFWNSMLDVFCFLVDVAPWSILIVWTFYVNCRRKGRQAMVGILFMLLYTFVYSWGTRNAGTAMRHRGQLMGIVIMAILVGIQGKIKESVKITEEYGEK